MKVTPRDNIFYIIKRVPKRFQSVDPREQVWISLHTDSETEAKRKAPDVWDHQVAVWEARLAGKSEAEQEQLAAVRDLAALRGYKYLPAERVAALPTTELLDRVEAVPMQGGQPNHQEAVAILGGAKVPNLTISEALEQYWKLAKDKTIGKSEDQIRKWRNPHKRAIRNLITVIGDKEVGEIRPDDTLDFRDWLTVRIQDEEIKPSTANKDIGHVAVVLNTVNERKRLGLNLPLTGLNFKTDDSDTRRPFSDTWIKETILAEGAMRGLNDEARAIVILMINTGARPSELAGLRAQDIRLTDKTPHISIEPYKGHQLKNSTARRAIPVTGVSLVALQKFPEGFPRYATSAASLSGTVNKYFRNNGLKETPDHTFYGLRHSFEDRMLAEPTVDERIRRDLMGHSLGRQRYGQGATLEHAHKLLQAKAI